MTALIVDDEPISVEGLSTMLDWNSLGITTVIKAYSTKQAQQIFESSPVDIMLSDIEMPRGSGIELMQWVREKGYPTLCIFLTSFSKFEYASKAVKLQIFEYVLKPVEYSQMEEVLTRAVKKVQEDQEVKLYQTQGKYWQDNQRVILQHFWHNIIYGKISAAPASIQLALKKDHISPETVCRNHWLALLRCIPDADASQWPIDLWNFAVNNILEETFPGVMIIGEAGQDTWILLDAGKANRTEIQRGGQASIEALSKALPAEFLFFCNTPCPIEETRTVCNSLRQKAEHCLSVNGLFLWMDVPYPIAHFPEDFTSRWNNALLLGDTDLILEDINSYFASTKGYIIRREMMEALYHQLLKSVFHCLEFYKIPVNSMQPDQPKSYNPRQIMNSVSSFTVWAEILLNSVSIQISQYLHTSPVIDSVCKYIQENLNENLSRTVLANQVHINPDYLSTLFRQKMNCSLVEYITMERIRESKKLLLTTDLSVSDIAVRTGFQNISYFSKQFKRLENQTPFQYRKQKNG